MEGWRTRRGRKLPSVLALAALLVSAATVAGIIASAAPTLWHGRVATLAAAPSWRLVSAPPKDLNGTALCPVDVMTWAGSVLTFGGPSASSLTAPVPGDTCTYSAGHWTPVAVYGSAPETRAAASMAFDAADGYAVLFGGLTTYTELGGPGARLQGDTWTYRDGVWTRLNLTPSPSPRAGAAMAYDPSGNRLLLFGGGGGLGGGNLSDTWAFHGGAWTQLTTGSSPPGRARASMAYDALDGHVLLFGGLDGQQRPLNDTWTFSAGTWTRLTPAVAPSPRYVAGIAYDAEDRFVLLQGGENATTYLTDTWAFAAGAWTQLHPSQEPPAQLAGVLAFDPPDGYVFQNEGWAFGVPFVASLTASPAEGTAGEPMDFAANVSGGTPPYTIVWNFGDGSTNASISTSHAFAAPGDYNVSVLVGDSIGAITVARTTVHVQDILFGYGLVLFLVLFVLAPVLVVAIVAVIALRARRRARRPAEVPPSEPGEHP